MTDCQICNTPLQQLFFHHSLFCPNDCDLGGKKPRSGEHKIWIDKIFSPLWHGNSDFSSGARFVTVLPALTQSAPRYIAHWILNVDTKTSHSKHATGHALLSTFKGTDMVVIREGCDCDKCLSCL